MDSEPYATMPWEVIFHDDFADEFAGLSALVQEELLANAELLAALGP